MFRRHCLLGYLVCAAILLWGVNAFAKQGFSGTYSTNAGGDSWTLTLIQDAQNEVTGTLVSSGGSRYEVQAQAEDDAVYGVCASSEGNVFFEATFEGNVLYFMIMEVDANNMPDYNTAQEFTFTRRTGTPSAEPPPPPSVPQPSPSVDTGTRQPVGTVSGAAHPWIVHQWIADTTPLLCYNTARINRLI